MNNVEKFIYHFHNLGDTDINTVFSRGCCYWFAHILHSRFPDSRIMYDQIANHFAVKIDGRLYDITGDVTDLYQMERWCDIKDEALKQRIIDQCILFI